jgi:hypothetical protein
MDMPRLQFLPEPDQRFSIAACVAGWRALLSPFARCPTRIGDGVIGHIHRLDIDLRQFIDIDGAASVASGGRACPLAGSIWLPRPCPLPDRSPAPPADFADPNSVRGRSRIEVILNLVKREKPTLQQLLGYLAGARRHFVTAGTPEQIAGLIEAWFTDGAADGFNIMPTLLPAQLDLFSAEVIRSCSGAGCFGPNTLGQWCASITGLFWPTSVFDNPGLFNRERQEATEKQQLEVAAEARMRFARIKSAVIEPIFNEVVALVATEGFFGETVDEPDDGSAPISLNVNLSEDEGAIRQGSLQVRLNQDLCRAPRWRVSPVEEGSIQGIVDCSGS